MGVVGQSFNEQSNDDILKFLWDNSGEAIFILGHDGAVLNGNPAFQQLLGYKLEELHDISFPPFIANMTSIEHEQFLKQLKQGEDFPFEIIERIHKDGTKLSILASYHPINKGNVLAVVMYKDYTEQMNIQKRLLNSEYNYRMLIENLPETVIKQCGGLINLINPAGVQLLGQSNEADVIGRSLWDFVSSEQQEEIDGVIADLSEKSTGATAPILTVKLSRSEGEIIWVEMKIVLIKTKELKEIQLVLRDITSKREYESRLKHLAYHDPLTGLKNRTIFTDIISESIMKAEKSNTQLSIMYIDIDRFKSINDTLGHMVGDELLKQFANRLSETVRQKDIACRTGGDEFLVLLQHIPSEHIVEKIAKRLIASFQKPFYIDDKEIELTVSIGISIYPHDGLIGRDLIHHADVALYEAKKKRNMYKFYQP